MTLFRAAAATAFTFALASACGFDSTVRAFLQARFWAPFTKRPAAFERPGVQRVSEPFAGMDSAEGDRPLLRLREAYQRISMPRFAPFDLEPYAALLSAARADRSLSRREREEVDLIDAKIDLRAGDASRPEPLRSSRKKLEAFLRTARTPEFLSEARGWLARVHFLLGDQTAAGKLYLDELNRSGSNIGREELLTSLEMTYGYDGGRQLREHLEEYFDTPGHAAFAIQLATNPDLHPDPGPPAGLAAVKLLEKHADLLRTAAGANSLALLGMRAALHAGDPAAVRKLADSVPGNAPVREQPDFQWMLGSALFLSREYEAAEAPLRALFENRKAETQEKVAAAHGLCGVYFKTGDSVEQLRYALWLYTEARREKRPFEDPPSGPGYSSVYWAYSGWDLNLILELAPIDVLQSFLERYPRAGNVRLVRYTLAVRLTRENRYREAADLYREIAAVRRAPRIRRLATLYDEAAQSPEARYRLAEFLIDNANGVYFNDALWSGMQNYALTSETDARLTAEERDRLVAAERQLRDDQEERWRAYLILRDLARDAGPTPLGRRSATLAIRALRGISARFGRAGEIRQADIDLANWLRRHGSA